MGVPIIGKIPVALRHARHEWGDIRKAVVAKAGGEAASIVSGGMSSVIVHHTLLRKPWGTVETHLIDHVVLPNLEGMDKFLEGFPSIDPPKDRVKRHAMPPREQARLITEKLVDIFGLPVVFGIAGQLIGNQIMFKALKMEATRGRPMGITPRENLLIVGADQAAMFGGIYLLNKTLPNTALSMQQGLESLLEKLGMDPENAETKASWAVNKQVPNALAFLLSSYMTYRFMRD